MVRIEPETSPESAPETGREAEPPNRVEAIEDALVSLVRHVSSPRTWRRIAGATGTPLDRARYLVLRAVAENSPCAPPSSPISWASTRRL